MKRIMVWMFCLLLLPACNLLAGDEPVLIPTAAPAIDIEEDEMAPRATPEPGLPPTYTPAPTPDDAGAPPADTPLQPDPPAGEERETYVVQPGDTLGQIAQRFNVSLDDLARENNIQDINQIEVGQELIIPAR